MLSNLFVDPADIVSVGLTNQRDCVVRLEEQGNGDVHHDVIGE